MAQSYKVLGQLKPSAATLSTLYTVPGSTMAVISTLVVCNMSATAARYRIAVRPAGAAIADEHYIFYDVDIEGNSSQTITIGISLDETDVVSVYVNNATVIFNVFGSEIA